jgi:hypothetical protein
MLRAVVGGELTPVVTGTPEDENQPALQVYPNPTTGLVRWDNERIDRIEVLDLNGRLVQDIVPARGQKSAQLRNLPTGLYLFRLSDGQRTDVQRVVVTQ